MHILIVPNAFKHSLTAKEAAQCIEAGLLSSGLQFTSEIFPIADGGDGTGTLLIEKLKGSLIHVMVHDPVGREIQSSFGLTDGGHTAIIEMADASGIRLLHPTELNPLKASTFGTGELIKKALDEKVKNIVIALGGSATVDGGAGLLQALGVKFLDREDRILDARPEALADLATIDASGLDPRIFNCEIRVLCDVENKLVGETGAARVFGPQKGANPHDMELLDSILLRLSQAALITTGKDMASIIHGGAAGGVAAALYAFLNAKLVNGAQYFLESTGFADSLAKADLVITGEGSIDEQTLSGKGPFAVARMAKERGIRVIGLAGKVPQEISPGLKACFDVLLPIGNEPAELEEALQHTVVNLRRTAGEVGRIISLGI